MVRRIYVEGRKSIKEDEGSFVKITTPTAKKIFAEGETVYLLPNKVRLGNAWILPFGINDAEGRTFEQYINEYKYYNCNRETGNAVAFYKLV